MVLQLENLSSVSFLIDRFHVTSSLFKIQNQSFYPHKANKAVNLYLSAILQLNSVLCLETRAFWISELWQCGTQGYDRVC